MKRVVYREIAACMDAMHRCQREHELPGKEHLTEWIGKHWERAKRLTKEYMPSGSGFDMGTNLDKDRSTGDKLVLTTAFHHMDEHGYYTVWTDHTVIVESSLIHQFTLYVSGLDRNDIKQYISDCFYNCLTQEFCE
jgi:hypothetical protein